MVSSPSFLESNQEFQKKSPNIQGSFLNLLVSFPSFGRRFPNIHVSMGHFIIQGSSSTFRVSSHTFKVTFKGVGSNPLESSPNILKKLSENFYEAPGTFVEVPGTFSEL